DGQTERLNQCLETYLRCTVHACPKKWFEWLHLAEYWYNTTYHSALEKTPFEVLYGHVPRHLGIVPSTTSSVADLDAWLQERSEMLQLLHQQLLRAQQRMKSQADTHRSERSFEVGDSVYLKLQPYIQTSLADRLNQKLSFRFFGPYKILARIGNAAYRLDLPKASQVH
uniref:Tf2-1-like SH3-like domain-containing protein n=1 Tax=Triticum urartu TaxID=4572 RepID=A0A8R7Q7P2_TRIUA